MDKRRVVDTCHRIFNPVARRLPGQVILETTGRASGQPRRTPIGGQLSDGEFWFVSMHGDAASYVRNIKANNMVRIRIGGRWRTGTAHLLPEDDARARNAQFSWVNRTANSALGGELLTIRIDLDRQ